MTTGGVDLTPAPAARERAGTGALLPYAEVHAMLEAAGVALPRERLCPDAAAAAAAAAELGVPVALKLISPELAHKSDSGGVRLGLAGADAVRDAGAALERLAAGLGLAAWQLLVQEMAPPSEAEVFVGLKHDPVFGPVVLAGPGGRLVELLRATAVRRCPVDADEARRMIAETPLATLLGGYRGAAAADVDALAEVVSAVSRLPASHPELGELDLNPLLADPERGFVAVDARAVARAPAPAPERSPAHDLRPLLDARSVVVIGASERRGNRPANLVLRYLRAHGYGGRVLVVHPTAAEVDGVAAYPSLDDLPGGEVDLACIAVGAARCAEVLAACGRRGVRAAVVHSSGFSEAGDAALEAELVAVAREHSMVLCGPNSVGIITPREHLHVSFTQAQNLAHAPAGDVALLAQSGALGGALLTSAWARGIGISRFVSVGNQGQLSTADYLEFLAGDERTRCACVLLEGVADGDAFVAGLESMRRAGKPVVVLKVGRGEVGAQAVLSHTGSLAGDAEVYGAVLRETGAIAVESLAGLLDVAALATSMPAPAGRRVGVLSTSGGACALLADQCERHGLELPPLPVAMRERLAAVLPAFAALGNPVDVTGEVASTPELYGEALRIVLEDEAMDIGVLMLTTISDPAAAEIARAIVEQVRGTDKPVLVSWTIAPELAPDALGILAGAGIPVFAEPERAIAALAAVVDRAARP